MEKIDIYVEKGTTMAMEYLPKLALAILTLIVGIYLINLAVRFLKRAMVRREVDPSLVPFTSTLVNVALKTMLLISVASMVGIQTTSFIAVLGAAGLAIGLALQGSLANFAGGVLILVFKPFRVGDAIDAQGFAGIVKSIQIFNTILHTFDNKKVIIPNGSIASGPITNFSAVDIRRVDMEFGIGYGDDLKKAKDILKRLIDEDDRVLQEPDAPFFAVKELGESSVNIVVRAWSKASDYWGIYFDMQEKVKLTFDAEGISIPFPQRDVHIYQDKSNEA
ncbi:MAG: mechanosensitive ion channel [Cyclobacteriaceae bacterium]|nr:mechanosensitive ion channel [Cyclobacteriaceae bacterium]